MIAAALVLSFVLGAANFGVFAKNEYKEWKVWREYSFKQSCEQTSSSAAWGESYTGLTGINFAGSTGMGSFSFTQQDGKYGASGYVMSYSAERKSDVTATDGNFHLNFRQVLNSNKTNNIVYQKSPFKVEYKVYINGDVSKAELMFQVNSSMSAANGGASLMTVKDNLSSWNDVSVNFYYTEDESTGARTWYAQPKWNDTLGSVTQIAVDLEALTSNKAKEYAVALRTYAKKTENTVDLCIADYKVSYETVVGAVEFSNYKDSETLDITELADFNIKVASTYKYDTAYLYVDGVAVEKVSGGAHNLTFSKDSVYPGEHTVEVRAVNSLGYFESKKINLKVTCMSFSDLYENDFTDWASNGFSQSVASVYNLSPSENWDTYIKTVQTDSAHGDSLEISMPADAVASSNISPRINLIKPSKASNDVSLEFEMRFPDGCYTSASQILFLRKYTSADDTNNINLTLIGTDGKGSVYFGLSASDAVKTISVNPDKWYKVKALILLSEGTVTYYLSEDGGDLKAIGSAPLTDSSTGSVFTNTSWNELRLMGPLSYSPGRSVWFDNIKTENIHLAPTITQESAPEFTDGSVRLKYTSGFDASVDTLFVANNFGNVPVESVMLDSSSNVATVHFGKNLIPGEAYTVTVLDPVYGYISCGFAPKERDIEVLSGYFEYDSDKDEYAFKVSVNSASDTTVYLANVLWQGEKFSEKSVTELAVKTGTHTYSVSVSVPADGYELKIMLFESLRTPVMLFSNAFGLKAENIN